MPRRNTVEIPVEDMIQGGLETDAGRPMLPWKVVAKVYSAFNPNDPIDENHARSRGTAAVNKIRKIILTSAPEKRIRL